jgi:hypothetical protein
LYDDPSTDKFTFIGWGVDAAFSENHPFREKSGPMSVLAQGILATRLYNHPEGRMMYLSKMQSLLDNVWNEASILSEIDEMEGLVKDLVIRPRFTEGVNAIRNFVRNRKGIVQADLDQGGLEWNPEAPDTICREPRGRLQGDFTTTWGTHPTSNSFLTGQGTMSLEFEEYSIPGMSAGASAGMGDDEDSERAAFVTVGAIQDGSGYPILYFSMPPEKVQSGETYEVDGETVRGVYLYKPANAQLIYVGELSSGSVTFDTAGTSTTSDIAVRYDVEVF